jgi:hypothetical protein
MFVYVHTYYIICIDDGNDNTENHINLNNNNVSTHRSNSINHHELVDVASLSTIIELTVNTNNRSNSNLDNKNDNDIDMPLTKNQFATFDDMRKYMDEYSKQWGFDYVLKHTQKHVETDVYLHGRFLCDHHTQPKPTKIVNNNNKKRKIRERVKHTGCQFKINFSYRKKDNSYFFNTFLLTHNHALNFNNNKSHNNQNLTSLRDIPPQMHQQFVRYTTLYFCINCFAF